MGMFKGMREEQIRGKRPLMWHQPITELRCKCALSQGGDAAATQLSCNYANRFVSFTMGSPQMVRTCDLTGMEGSEERQRDGNQFLTSSSESAVCGGRCSQLLFWMFPADLVMLSRLFFLDHLQVKGSPHRCVTMTSSSCSLSVCSPRVQIVV